MLLKYNFRHLCEIFFYLQNPMASRELSTTTVKSDIGFPSALALTKFAAGGAMFTAFMNGFKVINVLVLHTHWNIIGGSCI